MWIRLALAIGLVVVGSSSGAAELAPRDVVAQQTFGQPLAPPAPMTQPGGALPMSPAVPMNPVPPSGQVLPSPVAPMEPASPSSQMPAPATSTDAQAAAGPRHYRRIFKGSCSHGSLQFQFVDLEGTVAYTIHGVEYVAKLTFKSVPQPPQPGVMAYNHWEEAAHTGHRMIDAWRIARRADHCGTYAVEYLVKDKWHAYPAKLHRIVAQ